MLEFQTQGSFHFVFLVCAVNGQLVISGELLTYEAYSLFHHWLICRCDRCVCIFVCFPMHPSWRGMIERNRLPACNVLGDVLLAQCKYSSISLKLNAWNLKKIPPFEKEHYLPRHPFAPPEKIFWTQKTYLKHQTSGGVWMFRVWTKLPLIFQFVKPLGIRELESFCRWPGRKFLTNVKPVVTHKPIPSRYYLPTWKTIVYHWIPTNVGKYARHGWYGKY